MKNIALNIDNARIESGTLKKIYQELAPEIKRIKEALQTQYSTQYASVYAPFDNHMHNQIKRLIAIKKALQPTILIVIGIGGSNLGTMAVLQALRGSFYNQKSSSIKIFFADSVDADYIKQIYLFAQSALESGKTVLINVISKSGKTTETIANFHLFVTLLQSFYPDDYQQYVIVTSDKNSMLHVCAQQHEMAFLEIPELIGGRYSVFSSVGLFPLGLLGIDIDALVNGARSITKICIEQNESNIAMKSAAVRYAQYSQGIAINDLFLFAVDFENIGKWYRQLMGESIGKECDMNDKKSAVGITPTVSLGTIDLHSVAQLYLGGPRDKLFMFVDVASYTECRITSALPCDLLAQQLGGESFTHLQHALFQGVCRAFAKKQCPFMQLHLPEKTPFHVGQMLQYMMIEMMLLGFLLKIDPFDQPHVELYKQETRKILNNE